MEEWPKKEKCPFQNGYAFRTDIHTTVKVINLNLLSHVLFKQDFQQLSSSFPLLPNPLFPPSPDIRSPNPPPFFPPLPPNKSPMLPPEDDPNNPPSKSPIPPPAPASRLCLLRARHTDPQTRSGRQ